MYYLFDGTYSGFLCCVFESFERKEFDVIPLTGSEHQNSFFQNSRTITTHPEKAKRVLLGIQKRVSREKAVDFYKVFLSEDRKAWLASYKIIVDLFNTSKQVLQNYGNESTLYFSKMLQKVGRESHRMEAFVRFSKTADGGYYAVVEPDFNVLPLIADFFKKRYADQQWLIYDIKRKYGILYDKVNVSEVQEMPLDKHAVAAQHNIITLDANEEKFQRLWQKYFTSTNIESRKNTKLHLQHVPKRYWKYLTEKKVG
ncbi:TIGR03915 family putative DNA repair protein [Gynurincola endophyticus]|uniref:TIGR03915 family putative DNA repair protein n=1 Tax=Gynurincola endophyticus TaxID=2479004 RepID=UPI000F8C5916|nr:TIGR03915 family putative DNA repair protein [Gynurincola endophyticus]